MHDMDAIYREHAHKVYLYLVGLTHSEQLAEELTQETFCKAVFSIRSFDGKCKISVWLCQIAKHLWYQHLDKKRRHPTAALEEDLPAEQPALEDHMQETETRLALYRVVHQLDEPYREVAMLRLGGGFSFGEIGQIMGQTENWARVTFYRAKQKIIGGMEPC